MKENYYYNKQLKSLARGLRKNSTPGEIVLWSELLRAKQMMGYRFLRQRPVLKYIADFLSKELKLIIEIDGRSHDDITKDDKRDQELEKIGFSVLRFTEGEVLNDLNNVSKAIENYILDFEEKHGLNPKTSF